MSQRLQYISCGPLLGGFYVEKCTNFQYLALSASYPTPNPERALPFRRSVDGISYNSSEPSLLRWSHSSLKRK